MKINKLIFSVLARVTVGQHQQTLSDGRTIYYLRQNKELNFHNARKWCSGKGGALPKPINEIEDDFLKQLGSTWLGFSVDEAETLPYKNWGAGEPNRKNDDGDRVQLLTGWNYGTHWGGTWNDGSSKIQSTCYMEISTGHGPNPPGSLLPQLNGMRTSNRALKQNLDEAGCIEKEFCSATWHDQSTMLCSGKYSTLRFAETTCQMSQFCDGIFEVTMPSGTHWELFSTTTSPCAYVRDVSYTKMEHSKNSIDIVTNNDIQPYKDGT